MRVRAKDQFGIRNSKFEFGEIRHSDFGIGHSRGPHRARLAVGQEAGTAPAADIAQALNPN